ncbi:MAG: HAD family hydrolase [Bacteroidales bacterium]|jgi:histidinol-phosphate phosphatase family protein|nr:HAD family hydrolase [Bacteroidales bacterium]MDD4703744.1 HAD family hydrolase [Bacteroidales bacterium]MDX9798351.1 HAD family hydrolase [Bacteroidales bacterium]
MKIREYKTLFLDRDGVINVRLIDDYVKTWKEFEFEKGALEALSIFTKHFETIFIVTNQQGVSKGLMNEDDLITIHKQMKKEIEDNGGRIDSIYYCTALRKENHFCRKPKVGMGLRARKDFRDIRFKQSIMVGDSISDMQFGKSLKMQTVFISNSLDKTRKNYRLIDKRFESLIDFAKHLEYEKKN